MARLLIEHTLLPNGETKIHKELDGDGLDFVIMVAEAIIFLAKKFNFPYQLLLTTIKKVCDEMSNDKKAGN